MERENKGIHCEVPSCIYHKDGGKCLAGKIKVGNPEATRNVETLCTTFELKNGNTSVF